jgi:hypothetical protein
MIEVGRPAPPKHLARHAQRWTDELLVAIQQHTQENTFISFTVSAAW